MNIANPQTALRVGTRATTLDKAGRRQTVMSGADVIAGRFELLAPLELADLANELSNSRRIIRKREITSRNKTSGVNDSNPLRTLRVIQAIMSGYGTIERRLP